MDTQLPQIKQRLSGIDIALALSLPVVGIALAAFYLTRPESRDRGLRLLGIVCVAWGVLALTWWVLFAGALYGARGTGTLSTLMDRIATAERSGQTWICGGIAIFVAAFVTIRLVQTYGQANTWRQLAARVGMTYRRGGCLELSGSRMSGVYRGRDLVLDTYTPTNLDTVIDVTRLRLPIDNPADGHMRLDHFPIGHAIGTAFRPQSQIRTGDKVFDRQFAISSTPRGFAVEVLASPQLRQRLLHVRENTEIDLTGNQLSLERAGIEKDATYLRFVFDLLVELADAVERISAQTRVSA